MTGSAGGTRKIRFDLGTKRNMMSISYLNLSFRTSHEVYKYQQKLVDSVRPHAPIGGLSVKPINCAREIEIFLSFHILNYVQRLCIMVPACVHNF